MLRMSGLDAQMLYGETADTHMHTLKVVLVEGSCDAASVAVAVQDRIQVLFPLGWRVVRTPMDLHHPCWVEDPTLHVDDHVHAVDVPQPRDRRALDRVIAEVTGARLDPGRPLWEIHVTPELSDGTTAVIGKVHHNIADGVAAANLLAALLDGALPGGAVPDPVVGGAGEPTRSDLYRAALVDHGRYLRRLPAVIAGSIRGSRRRRALLETSPVQPPGTGSGPRTLFNQRIPSPARTFASATVPLVTFKEVSRATGTTINDVVLAVTAGAVRAFLLDRGSLPDQPLTAGVPVSADPPGVTRYAGNHVSNVFTSLCSDLADPVERLHRIHQTMTVTKAAHEAIGGKVKLSWFDYLPHQPITALMDRGLDRMAGPPVNMVVSNVPGPRVAGAIAGAAVCGLLSVGPIIHHIGLNLTVWSYVDDMHLGVLSHPAFLDDDALHDLADRWVDALDELVTAIRA